MASKAKFSFSRVRVTALPEGPITKAILRKRSKRFNQVRYTVSLRSRPAYHSEINALGWDSDHIPLQSFPYLTHTTALIRDRIDEPLSLVACLLH